MTSVCRFLKSGTVHIGIGAMTVKVLVVVEVPRALSTFSLTVHVPAG